MSVDATSGCWRVQCLTLCELFEKAVQASPEQVFCTVGKNKITYAQAFAVIDHMANSLRNQVADRPVALCLPNSFSFLVTYHAVLRARGRPALLNVMMPPEKLAGLVKGLDAGLAISRADVAGVSTRIVDDEEMIDLARSLTIADVTPAKATGDDVGAIFYSGGTTGPPKRMAHSHRALMAKIERMEWGWPTKAHEIWLPVAPFTHIYGYLMGVANPLLKAANIVIPERFKPELVVDLMESEKVTVFGGGPPAIYQGIMAANNFIDADLSALRVCPGGGAPFPAALHKRWAEATGLNIFEGLGMTEIAPIAVNNESSGRRLGTVGKPCPDTVVEIVDLKSGDNILAAGQVGEIRVKGPHMMTGYDDNPDETAALIRNGFIYTGDIGVLDEDGFLTITDRKKDVIFHKGFNVFPREIEEVLMSHDNVHQVCVVGREDERAGEVAIAFVCASANVEADALIEHCRQNLAAYQLPSQIRIEENLPLTPAGKPDRMAMRELARA